MGVEVKKEVLRLLREDEEFRYAVAGLIGLEDIRKGQDGLRLGLARLEEAHARLEVAVARLQEAVAKLEEAVAKLQDVVASLAKEQQRTSGALRRLIRYISSMSITLEEEAYFIVEKRLSL
jgi:exonuclease VII small subunit